MDKTKVVKFKQSKFNNYLNKANIFLLILTVLSYILFYFLIMLLVGLSMWRANYEIGMPLSVTDYNNVSKLDNMKIHLVNLEDNILNYEVSAEISIVDYYQLSSSSEFGIIDKVFINNDEIEVDDQNDYLIPEGTYNIKLKLIKEVKVVTYKGVTSAKVEVNNNEEISVSNFFKPLNKSENKTEINLITASSTGKYVKEIYRTPFYQGISKIFWFTVIYTSINAVKIIVLWIVIRNKSDEIIN